MHILAGRALGFWKWCSRIFFKGRGKLNFFVLYFLITSNPNMAKIWCSRCYTCYTPNALPGDKTSPFNQNLIKALWSVYIPPIYVECARLKSKINFRFECLIQLTLNYRIDANTTALLIRTALDNFLTKSPLFGTNTWLQRSYLAQIWMQRHQKPLDGN